jgi:hypothetical protein
LSFARKYLLHENIWKASGAARSAIGGARLLIAM